jgi:hypothetical protein
MQLVDKTPVVPYIGSAYFCAARRRFCYATGKAQRVRQSLVADEPPGDAANNCLSSAKAPAAVSLIQAYEQ